MIEIGKKTTYLVLDSQDQCARRFKVCDSFQKILEGWNETTRYSPAFTLAIQDELSEAFQGNWNLFFLGPCHPFDFCQGRDLHQSRIWFTMGLYNIVYATRENNALDDIKAWVLSKGVSCEVWSIRDGVITKTEILAIKKQNVSPDAVKAIVNFPLPTATNVLRPAITEYLPLVSATLYKSGIFAPQVLEELQQFHVTIGKSLGDCASDFDVLNKLNLLTVVNAGLSHFCSQTFSGVSPIYETVNHFWSHSLLGIGVANLALWNIKTFIENSLWQAAIPERIEAFRGQPAVLITQDELHEIWKKDYLISIPDKELKIGQIVRSVAYFSGRDGFRSSRCTVSAPLAAVDACNSQKWNLLTITHELTHILTDGCLARIVPDTDSPVEMDKACQLLKTNNCLDLMDSIQLLFLKGAISIYTFYYGDVREKKFEVLPRSVEQAIKKSDRLINEIITHILDFKYFYESSAVEYASSVWSSWGVLPKGNGRIKEYLLRTLSALLTNHIGRQDAYGVVRAELINELTNIAKNETQNQYIANALELLGNDISWKDLQNQLVSVHPIILLASTFLFSETLAAPFSREKAIHSRSGKDGYILTKHKFERERITNKIRFLLEYATEITPNPATSAWILFQLAFSKEDASASK